MTVRQKQCLLAYLGYYEGDIDGEWGPLSRSATEAFQRDYQLAVDGIFGDGTAQRIREVIYHQEAPMVQEKVVVSKKEATTFWDEIEFFTREEFRCQCGGKYCNGFPVEPDEKMVRTVDEIRRRLGIPITVSSGIRCQIHNANVGGVSNSEHLYGRAADLHSSASPARMKEVAEEVMGNTGGIGLYGWGIHVDVGKYSRWNG